MEGRKERRPICPPPRWKEETLVTSLSPWKSPEPLAAFHLKTEVRRHGRRSSLSGASSNGIFISNETMRSDLSKARETEEKLAQQDRQIQRAKEQRNNLEAYVYKSRNKIMASGEESARDIVSRKLTETEAWLYQEGDDQPEHVYITKLQELKRLMSPYEIRNECKIQVQEGRGVRSNTTVLGSSSFRGNDEINLEETNCHTQALSLESNISPTNRIISSISGVAEDPRIGLPKKRKRMGASMWGKTSNKGRLKKICKRISAICSCRETDATSPSPRGKANLTRTT